MKKKLGRAREQQRTYLAINEFQVLWTLRVAVTSTVVGTGLVSGVLAHPTVSVHRDEIKSAVKTTGELRNVDIKGEFVVLELEFLVLGARRVHKVRTGANVGAGLELEG